MSAAGKCKRYPYLCSVPFESRVHVHLIADSLPSGCSTPCFADDLKFSL